MSLRLLGTFACLLLVISVASTVVIGCGGSGSGGAGGVAGTGGGGGAGGGAAGSAGRGADSGVDGSQLMDCTGLVCGSDQQGVRVRSPALGTIQCGCIPIPSAGRCLDCTCGASICAQYQANCTGFSLETGLLCTEPG
jgi:hypothetical protein